MGGRSQGVVVRHGNSDRYWYVNALYLGLATLYGISLLVPTTGATSFEAVRGVSVWATLLLIVVGLASYGTIFEDAAYARHSTSWRPTWWHYALGGLGTPLAVFAILRTGSPLAGLVSMFSFLAVTAVVNAVYLYRRHAVVGVP